MCAKLYMYFSVAICELDLTCYVPKGTLFVCRFGTTYDSSTAFLNSAIYFLTFTF